jgi:hypothetical protein
MAALAEDFPDFPASFVLSRKGTHLLMDAHNHKYRIHSNNTDKTIAGPDLPASGHPEHCEGFCQHETQGRHGHDCQHAHKVALFSYVTPLFMYQI